MRSYDAQSLRAVGRAIEIPFLLTLDRAGDRRLACRCAQCVDEMSGRPLLDPASVALDVKPVRIWSLGNYAVGIAFSDGHQSGIYPFATLRALQAAEAEDV